jgi:hypothetical protein
VPDIRSAFTSDPQPAATGNPQIDELMDKIRELQARMQTEVGPALSADMAQLKILQQGLAWIQAQEKMKAEQAASNTGPRSPQLPNVANIANQSPIAEAAKKATTPAMEELATTTRLQNGQPPSENSSLDQGKAFWKWMQTKKAAGGLGSLQMYDYGPDDIRATPLAIKQLMDQNPTYYKQFMSETSTLAAPAGPPAPPPGPPAPPPQVAPPVRPPQPPPAPPPQGPPLNVAGPMRPPEQGIAQAGGMKGPNTQPSAKGQDFWAQLGSVAKSTGQSILEILNAGLVGYTGNKVPTAQAQRMDKEFQERMAKLDTASRARELKTQIGAQEARDVTQGAQSEKELGIEHQNRMEELQSQQTADLQIANVQNAVKQGQITQSAASDLIAAIQKAYGGD